MAKAGSKPLVVDSEATLRHCLLALDEGISFIESQPGHANIAPTIDAIMGIEDASQPLRRPGRSRTKFNKLGKIALDLKSMYTDIKPFWVFRTNNKRFERQADALGKLSRWWYLNRHIDQRFVEVIDWTLAGASGYLHLFWNPDLGESGDVDARAEDPRDVFPIRCNDKQSLQGAAGVIIRRERPTSYLRAKYPHLAKKIDVERQGSLKDSGFTKKLRNVTETLVDELGPFWALHGGGTTPKSKLGEGMPITDEFIYYLRDRKVNEKPYAVEVGEFETVETPEGKERRPKYPYCYTVDPGKPLYPRGRMIVFTRFGVMEDGPNPFLHGMFPICKFTLDSWAWTYLGKAPLWDLLPMQRSVDRTLRVIEDIQERQRKPWLIYDKNVLPDRAAAAIHTDAPGGKIGHNTAAGQPPAIVDVKPPDASIFTYLDSMLTGMDELAGAADLKNIAALNQIPSTETIDKMIESFTPAVRMRSRALEVPVRDFAKMLAGTFMQYYDLDKRLRILGEDGVTAEDWDYKQRDMVPDFIDDEDYRSLEEVEGEVDEAKVVSTRDVPTLSAQERGPKSFAYRVSRFLDFFEFEVAPGSLLDAATTTKRLIYLQLSRMGLVDHWTLLEAFNVPNVGKPPSWAVTITDRLKAEAELGIGMIASTVGRKPTAQAMPTLTSTGAVSESG